MTAGTPTGRAGKALTLLFLLSATGCFDLEPKENAILRRLGGVGDPLRLVLAVPTKDDLALIDGIQFSITAYQAISDEMTVHDFDSVYWVGLAAITLQSDFLTKRRELPSLLAIAVARYALGDLSRVNGERSLTEVYGHPMNIPPPDKVRRDLEALIKAATVLRNEVVIADIRASVRR